MELLIVLYHITIFTEVEESTSYPNVLWSEICEVFRANNFGFFVLHELVNYLAPYIRQFVFFVMPLETIFKIFKLFSDHLWFFRDLWATQVFSVKTFEIFKFFYDLLLVHCLVVNSFCKPVYSDHWLLLPVVEGTKNEWAIARKSWWLMYFEVSWLRAVHWI